MKTTTQDTRSRVESQYQTTTPPPKTFLSVRAFSEKHPDWKTSSLRWLIFHRKTNGFAGVFKKVQKAVLIDEAAFFERIENSTMD